MRKGIESHILAQWFDVDSTVEGSESKLTTYQNTVKGVAHKEAAKSHTGKERTQKLAAAAVV
ncbi:Zinc finger, RING-type [Prunus dulcis]|uniref:Zinc finger, RING-type n=1 Tax=Prunus dulcis TaxID=3755 RepID=A0A4Y1R6Y7_PRUDU|nr:Zinc finger, RING-type [Prunus dulcis]